MHDVTKEHEMSWPYVILYFCYFICQALLDRGIIAIEKARCSSLLHPGMKEMCEVCNMNKLK